MSFSTMTEVFAPSFIVLNPKHNIILKWVPKAIKKKWYAAFPSARYDSELEKKKKAVDIVVTLSLKF